MPQPRSGLSSPWAAVLEPAQVGEASFSGQEGLALFCYYCWASGASLAAQMVKNLPAVGETWFDP